MKPRRGFLALVLLAFAARLQATSLTLAATQTGWYDDSGFTDVPGQNYITGWWGGMATEIHSFFIFDLTGLAGTITTAQLQLYNPSASDSGGVNGYHSPDPTETFALFDVSSSLADLQSGTGGTAVNIGLFNDLSSGTSFGSVNVSAADNGTLVTIDINSAGLAAMNSSGGLFAIGGALTTLTKAIGTSETVFTNTGAANTRQLLLTTNGASGTASPEPATGILLAVPLIAMGLRGHRRKPTAP